MNCINYIAEPVLRKNAMVGESPVWDDRNNALFWIDSLNNQVCIFNPKTGENKTYDVGQNIGSVILTENSNKVVVGLVDGIYVLDLTNGELSFKVDPEPNCPGNRLNDGKADAAGRIWIGSMMVSDNGVPGFDSSCECNLHCIGLDFKSVLADSQVRLSNGIAWTGDNQTMYYVDSPTRNLYAYDFNLITGETSNKRICFSIPDELGVCDGMDIDIEGNLWIAHWGGWCVGKWDPRTGKLLGKIEIPVNRVSSCAFGGRDYDELYITTASIYADQDKESQPEAGYLYVAKNLGTKGLPFNRFRGVV